MSPAARRRSLTISGITSGVNCATNRWCCQNKFNWLLSLWIRVTDPGIYEFNRKTPVNASGRLFGKQSTAPIPNSHLTLQRRNGYRSHAGCRRPSAFGQSAHDTLWSLTRSNQNYRRVRTGCADLETHDDWALELSITSAKTGTWSIPMMSTSFVV